MRTASEVGSGTGCRTGAAVDDGGGGTTEPQSERKGSADAGDGAAGAAPGPCTPAEDDDPDTGAPADDLPARSSSAEDAAARSGRRCRFVLVRLVLSWRPVARARRGQADRGIAATLWSVNRLPGLTRSPVSRPVTGPAAARCLGYGDQGPLRARAVEPCTVRPEGQTCGLRWSRTHSSCWSVRPRSGSDVGQREANPAQRPVLIPVVGPAPVARI